MTAYAEEQTASSRLRRLISGENGPLLLLAAVSLLLHFATSGRFGRFRDEFYYMACGEHLDFGYVDHAPLIAIIARLTQILFGDSLFAWRLLPAIAGAALVVLAGLIARELGGGRTAQSFAALATLCAPVLVGTAHLLSMNVFEQVFWTLAALLLIRLFRTQNERLWLPLGLVFGLGLLNKHSMLFFGFGLFVGMLLTPERRYFLSRPFWLGLLIAVLLFLPNVIWENVHGWPTLEFLRNAERYKNYPVTPPEFLLGQVLQVQPVMLPLWLAGVIWLLRTHPYRALGWLYLAILTVFIVAKAKDYYLAPIYPLLFAAGAVAREGFFRPRTSPTTRRLIKPVAAAVLVLGGLVTLPLALPVLSPADTVRYGRWLGVGGVKTERNQPAALPQYYADMFGWDNMVATVARAYAALPAADRARCAIYASNYGEAGAIDFLGRAYGLPKSICGHNSYWLWGPHGASNEVVLTIGPSREDASKEFESVEQVATVVSPYAMPYETDLPIFLCRRPKRTMQQLWPTVKHYI